MIGDDGAAKLADGVQHCQELQRLYLDGNCIGFDRARSQTGCYINALRSPPGQAKMSAEQHYGIFSCMIFVRLAGMVGTVGFS